MVRSKKAYWTKGPGQYSLHLISLYRAAKTWRPTVVDLVVNDRNEFFVGQRNTREREWVFVQGEMEATDSDPVDAGVRELCEEAFVPENMIAGVIEYLTEADIPYMPAEPQWHDTGYTVGRSYKCIGIRLAAGYDISLVPPPGHTGEIALLDYRWCSYDEAVELLRTQPGVEQVTESNRLKCELVLIPAMDAFFEHEREQKLISNV